MITGAHFLLYSKDPEADRAFFRDVLGFRAVDLCKRDREAVNGEGWLIFALPPAELGIHPGAATSSSFTPTAVCSAPCFTFQL